MLALAAALPRPAAGEETFAGFIIGLRDVCANAPARECSGRVMAFLDGDEDGSVSLPEFERVRRQALATAKDNNSGLSNIERSFTTVGLLTLKQSKLATVFANFDGDGDGGLSEAELFADFGLERVHDRRPMAEIVAAPNGVDWTAFATRFGKVGFLIIDLLPPSHRQ